MFITVGCTSKRHFSRTGTYCTFLVPKHKKAVNPVHVLYFINYINRLTRYKLKSHFFNGLLFLMDQINFNSIQWSLNPDFGQSPRNYLRKSLNTSLWLHFKIQYSDAKQDTNLHLLVQSLLKLVKLLRLGSARKTRG